MNPPTPIIRIALPVPLRQAFDYLPPPAWNLKKLQPGIRIKVPFQHRELIGILLEIVPQSALPSHKLKTALEVIDQVSLFNEDIWQLCFWAAEYYHYPLGEVLQSAIPILLRQGKPAELSQENYYELTAAGQAIDPATVKRGPKLIKLLTLLAENSAALSLKQLKQYNITTTTLKAALKKNWVASALQPTAINHIAPPLLLNTDQQQAVSSILNALNTFQVFLLDGITGSGKTEVYLQTIHQVIADGKQALILVPEIGLTPQTIQRFRERFSVPIVALHSGLSEKERLNAWLLSKSGVAKIIIGTRSAIFSPFAQLGLIIVDEEHDLSFKQQDSFRYHARDLAVKRAQHHHIPIVLGSATPSLETLYNAECKRYHHIILPARAGLAKPPTFQIIDIRNTHLEEGLSLPVIQEMKQHLQAGNQVMLFLNRRGFAPVLMCHACGWTMKCKRCEVRMTYHQKPPRLHCHHCEAQRSWPKCCENCKSPTLHAIGLGTERLEQTLQQHFSEQSIARVDRDNAKGKGQLETLLHDIHRGDHQILIGTQMLAKGHHFPEVTLVVIIDVDGGLFSTDFRAIERMGQLLLQVAGRAGRVEKPGKVLIQTRHPDHPLLHQLIDENYYAFASTLLKERQTAILPPFVYFALFRAESHQAANAHHFLQQVKACVVDTLSDIQILGPIPSPMPKRAGYHRTQLLLQARRRSSLQIFLKDLLVKVEGIAQKKKVRWSIDIDPLEMY